MEGQASGTTCRACCRMLPVLQCCRLRAFLPAHCMLPATSCFSASALGRASSTRSASTSHVVVPGDPAQVSLGILASGVGAVVLHHKMVGPQMLGWGSGARWPKTMSSIYSEPLQLLTTPLHIRAFWNKRSWPNALQLPFIKQKDICCFSKVLFFSECSSKSRISRYDHF